jgi:hypothetical protein
MGTAKKNLPVPQQVEVRRTEKSRRGKDVR